MLPITQDLLTSRKNRPALRNSYFKLRKVRGIVIHWTANPSRGADAKANRNYFNKGERFASAHYCVDHDSIIQCLPDEELAYHVGATRYRPIGLKLSEGNMNPNYFTIGIEMCINLDSDWKKTYQNTVDLTRHLLKKFDLTSADVYTHHDITGKDCPKMMLNASEWTAYLTELRRTRGITLNIPFNTWEQFKKDVNLGLVIAPPPPEPGKTVKKGSVNTAELNVRSGPGTQFEVLRKLGQGAEISIFEEQGNWMRIGAAEWVGKLYVVVHPNSRPGEINTSTFANVRGGASARFPVLRTLANGETVDVLEVYDGWCKIGLNEWVHSTLVKFLTVTHAKVVHVQDFLNVRNGPGTNFARVGTLLPDALVKYYETENGFARIGDDQWVNAKFLADIA